MHSLHRIITVGFTALAVAATTAVPAAAAHRSGAPYGSGPIVLWASTSATTADAPSTFVYDRQLVPTGAAMAVYSVSQRRRTETLLVVSGLVPDRAYGGHLHVNACGAAPTAAGPHYQRVPDPVQPSTNPAYANPRNEVWLDLHTNARGAARTVAVNRWRYGTPPRSLVIHASSTATHADHAGTAGARIACLTLAARS